jgi:Ca-activated chloride channel homolog
MTGLLSIWFWEYEFLSPHWLWLLLVVPALLFLRFLARKKQSGDMKISRASSDLKSVAFDSMRWVVLGIYLILGLAFSLLIMAMAKPFDPTVDHGKQEYGEGVDIILCMDISGSMLATDFIPNRLEAAKEVAKDFVSGRPADRIGLVVFEGEAYTACPATRNHAFLKKAIDNIQPGWLDPGTAIGTGLGTAVSRLRSDTLQSKVIILLTDGESNKGEITPLQAAELAKNKNVRVYTIGVGQDGYVSMPVSSAFGTLFQQTLVSIDEKELKEIAKITGGQYFRATDKNSLKEIYQKIEEMEKTKIVEQNFDRDPPYAPGSFLFWGMILLFVAISMENFLFRTYG